MSSSKHTPRIQWMINMTAKCFKANPEDLADQLDLKKIEEFLAGKLGQTLLIYYQNPYQIVNNEKIITSTDPIIKINEAKSIELINKAAFFGRTIDENLEFKPELLNIQSDDKLYFGEITNESSVSMSKVISTYLSSYIDTLEKKDWEKMDEEQTHDFKKILKSFAKEINEIVESYIKGINFMKVPEEIKETLLNKKNNMFVSDESNQETQLKIEEIYRSWINTLSNEIDFEKDAPSDINDLGPKHELEKWKNTMQRLTKVIDFFKSKDYRLLATYFMEQKNKNYQTASTLYNEMKQKKMDAHTAQASAKDNLRYLSTLEIYFDPLYSGNPKTIIDSLQSLMNSLKLISFTARYYDNTKMTNLFSRITDQMILSCKKYILDGRDNSVDNNKYLFERDSDALISKFEDCKSLYHAYKEKYKEAKSNATSTNKENNFDFGENVLFGRFDQFCKRLNKLIDLFTTMKQFKDIESHKLDSMGEIIESYKKNFKHFYNQTTDLLDFNKSGFEKEYVQFNLSISDVENNLHKKINNEIKQLGTIEKKLKLLAKYESIISKPNLQQNLKSEKIEIYSSYKREIDKIQSTFESGRNSPPLQRNVPKISGRIKWAKHLFNRIYPYIDYFKDISIKEKGETELAYMTSNTLLYSYIRLNIKFFEQFVEIAKNKLNAPLLYMSDTYGPQVNLDLYVLQLIRETKCMIRMNCEIPEAAKIILLQEDKFKKYYNELKFLVKEYNRILAPISGMDTQNYFKSHITDLNLKMKPLQTTVNWSSMNIESNLTGVFSALQRLEYAITSYQDTLINRVDRNLKSLKKIKLLYIPDDSKDLTINALLRTQEEYVLKQNKYIQSKNIEIENAIIDIIDNIKSYKLDPKINPVEEKQLSKLLNKFENQMLEDLTTTTKISIENLKNVFLGEVASVPLFKVKVDLHNNSAVITPSIDEIKEAVSSMANNIISGMNGINGWKKLDNTEEETNFTNKIKQDTDRIINQTMLYGAIGNIQNKIKEYIDNIFEKFNPLFTLNIDNKIKEFNSKLNKSYLDYEEKLKEYNNIQTQIEKIPNEHKIGAVLLDLCPIKKILLDYCNDWKKEYLKELLRTTKSSGKDLNELLNGFLDKMNNKPDTIYDLKEIVNAIEEIRRKEGSIQAQIKPYIQYYNLVSEHLKEPYNIEKLNFPLKDSFNEKWQEILKLAVQHRDELQKNQLTFRKKLCNDVIQLKEDVSLLYNEFQNGGIVGLKNPVLSYEKIGNIRNKVNKLKLNESSIQAGEQLFNITKTEFPKLHEIENNLKKLEKLYNLYIDVLKQEDQWKETPWFEMSSKLEEMENKIGNFNRRCNQVESDFFKNLSEENNEHNDLKKLIQKLSNTKEAFEYLAHPYIEDIHWEDISSRIDVKEIATAKSDGGTFKTKLLFEGEIDGIRNDLEEIAGKAKTQNQIKNKLVTIEDKLKDKVFKFVPHQTRPTIQLFLTTHYIVLKQEIEDFAATIAGFKAQFNKLTEEIRAKIKVKDLQLQSIISNMEIWAAVQSLWASLQSFFIGGDIRKDLPGPTKKFEKSDKEWTKLMEKAVGSNSVVMLCSGTEITPTLLEIDEDLKDCQKHLDNYLENKRGTFPRFYFVSNSVLLDILSKKNDPASIKSNLNIIFDALNDIKFNEIDSKLITSIRQIKSETQPQHIQNVDLGFYAVKCSSNIEDWLNVLVDNMQLSIKDLFAASYQEFKDFREKPIKDCLDGFEKFIKKHICQVVLYGLQVIGTKKLEEFVIRLSTLGEPYKKKMLGGDKGGDVYKDPINQDFDIIQKLLTELCSGDDENCLNIVKYETLIIIHVHNRDVFDFILRYRDGTITTNDYDWLKQTRVYWHELGKKEEKYDDGDTPGTCIINITDVAFEYGYEFLGAKERMCITELTDKCYITLAQALGMYYGGAPAGPAGTGKTETVKDMARGMGLFVLVTNCSPENRFSFMAGIFKGLCKSGAWGCFDEFNRIDLEVLSVVATIISTIQDTKRSGLPRFPFPDSSSPSEAKDAKERMCDLKDTTAYFITMNPGYSGRNELPENLKVLFRGVTMMVADKQAIIRVKLSSYGFLQSDDLSSKFAKLYNLCVDQLSAQIHYDFGLRNILSVLRHAGNEKKKAKETNQSEEEIMYIALRDMNLSKYVPDDIQLFMSLINDVFPTQINAKEKQYQSLDKHLKEIIVDERKLDNKKSWNKKVIQTYETQAVRHGFMIVGATGTGKTTIMEVLTQAMERDSTTNQKWKIHRMNPKAFDQKYLYIEKASDIYILGTFTMLWKRCNEPGSNDANSYNNWLVCDGPVDAIWIENLNTVLDDNKILTLSNNDRIIMIDTCKLVFETENLKNASLATVSRCGMIYITEVDIEWDPYINSWFLKNSHLFKDNKNTNKDFKENNPIKDLLISKYINRDLDVELSQKHYNMVMDVSWLIRIKNFFLLFESILIQNIEKDRKSLDINNIEKIMVFALVWSIGGLYETENRLSFHNYLKNKKAPIPDIDENKNTIFEYRLDNNEWKPWSVELLKENSSGFDLKKEIENFSNLLVPTMDSARTIFLIDTVSKIIIEGSDDRRMPSLLLGDAGTAKTSSVLLYRKLLFTSDQVLKRINFSSATTPATFQATMDDGVEKQGHDFMPKGDKYMLVFIDDISMPFVNKFGDQITLELARQLMEYGGYYQNGNENRGIIKKLKKISFAAAMNHPKGGKNNIPNRLKRQFFIFNLVMPNEQSVNDIYKEIIDLYFPLKPATSAYDRASLNKMAQKLTGLTNSLLFKLKNKFQPTPIKFHYNFNMREMSRTFQGVFAISEYLNILKKSKINSKDMVYSVDTLLLILWKHEATRVFCDKLRDLEDKNEYNNILEEVIKTNLPGMENITDKLMEEHLFCDYLRPVEINENGVEIYPKIVELITDMNKVREITYNVMQEMKSDRKKKHVDIVLFDDCLKYLIRVTRIIQTQQGSAMLVGVGGSGKQSLTRLAAEVSRHSIVQMTSDRCDKLEEIKNEFRTIYNEIAATYNPATGKIPKYTFLMTDAELKLESFLETVSSFLATGDIPNLFLKKEDQQQINANARVMFSKIPSISSEISEGEVLNELITQVRIYLHIVLCFSPSSDKFREKYIKFPVLFNNTTIVWLLPWPEDALISVVNGFLKDKSDVLKLVATKEQKESLYRHMGNVHININLTCESYLEKMRKYVYVTPKSYLCFINEYIKLYSLNREEVEKKEKTIIQGLEKLKSAEEEIKIKSETLEKKMIVVNAKSVEVKEKEKVINKETVKANELLNKVKLIEDDCKQKEAQIRIDEAYVKERFEEAAPKLRNAIVNCKLKKADVTSIISYNISVIIKFYWECCMLLMSKKLLPIQDFQTLKAKNNYINYFVPDSFDLCFYYLTENAGQSSNFFTTLEEWQAKIENKSLKVNDETLEFIYPLVNLKVNDTEYKLFDKEFSEKTSIFCLKLTNFVKAIQEFVEAVTEVMPLQDKVNQNAIKLAVATEEYNKATKQKEVALEDKNKKEEELNKVVQEMKIIEDEANLMKDNLDKATKLINNLSGEKENWINDSKKFDLQKKRLLGDCAIAAGFLAYAGPFNYEFRNDIINNVFKKDLLDKNIPFDESMDVIDFLIDETTKGVWATDKLPSDTLSIQNGILVENSSRYPLLIDPQNQAKTWLLTKNPGITSDKTIYQQSQVLKKFEEIMAMRIEYGDKVIIEGIENEVDSKLDSVLEMNFISPPGSKTRLIKLGDIEAQYDPEFKLYMLCKIITPHFTPELAAKTTIIDFNVTISGLEQQLQGIVVYKEQKQLEDTLKSIISEITMNKKSLVECQKAILQTLNDSKDLIGDSNMMKILIDSKSKSNENTIKVKDAEEKKKDINQQREKYLPVAIRGAVLYFSIVNMQEISKMYSTSIQQFQNLFDYAIDNSQKNKNKEIRVNNIVHKLNEHVYKYVVRGLFKNHKMTFLLIVCFKILTTEKSETGVPLLNNTDLGSFIKAGEGILSSKVENCPFSILTTNDSKPKEWLNMLFLENHKFNNSTQYFSKLREKINMNPEKFNKFYCETDCENHIPYEELYNQSNKKLSSFLKLMFVRCIRNDRTIIYSRNFIQTVLEDENFLKPYSEGVETYYKETKNKMPILYLLSAGADPTAGIEDLRKRYKKQMVTVSMGENQEKAAAYYIERAIESGDWVLLQNCHLGLAYMAELDSLLKNANEEDFHPTMRIWLSCEPTDKFPVGLLHQSFKVTNEPPNGIQASMIKTFSSVVNQDKIDKYEFVEWRKLIFALSFLHSLVLERKKYGPLGWCVPYDFNDSDLESSIIFIDKQFNKELELDSKKPPHEMINFKTLVNVVSTILYGGRITDRKDGELFKTIMGSFLEKSLLSKEVDYQFYPLIPKGGNNKNISKDDIYKMPGNDIKEIKDYICHIENFPNIDPPGVFGLHGSADLTFRVKEFKELLDSVQITMPTDGGSGEGMSKEDDVKAKVKEFLNDMPKDFIEREYRDKIRVMEWGGIGTGLKVPLHNVLLQEIQRVQIIIDLVKQSLIDIREALHGRLMMTEEIISCVNALFSAKPPKIWMYNANDSEISWLSPFASSWFQGLKNRAERLREWLDCPKLTRPAFWLPGFLNPQGFIGAFKQEVFKINKTTNKDITLDRIGLEYVPAKSETDPKAYMNSPEGKITDDHLRKVSIIVYGLYIEGAMWGKEVLQDDPDTNSRTPIKKFPVMRIDGKVEDVNKNATGGKSSKYKCPLYKYLKRTDKYFIMEITLSIPPGNDTDERFWQKRGVAMLCNQE